MHSSQGFTAVKKWLFPILLCAFGLYFTFSDFWKSFDAINGDIGDARFNALTLEHTWLWLKGIHPDLFNRPMFYPHANTYAYSDYMLGAAPLYWFFRSLGSDILLSYQSWMIACCALNFAAFFAMAKKTFQFSTVIAAIGAYAFAFSLPRITHLEHVQLVGQFWIVLSAMGAIAWWKNPKSVAAPIAFVTGACLQFISAFYFFWFWIWSLAMIAIFISINSTRRQKLKEWFQQISKQNTLAIFMVAGISVLPFLYHYVLAAKEMGARGWVVISNTVPRLYSWTFLPTNHWQSFATPFKEWALALPVTHEHYLSFGLITWAAMIAALVWVYRQKPLRYLSIPLLMMFAFTLTSGRFSSWVFMTYLFPGGTAIRAVSRIQIFMLLFWVVVLMHYLRYLSTQKTRALVALVCLALVGESFYRSEWFFSRSAETLRIQNRIGAIPEECEVLAFANGFAPFADFSNMDATWIANQLQLPTINGYSGNQPQEWPEVFFNSQLDNEAKVKEWLRRHQKNSDDLKICIL